MLQERKRRAQHRALSDLAKQRARFAATLTEEETKAFDEEASAAAKEHRQAGEAQEESPTCIICHQQDGAPVGFIGFAQSSRVLGRGGGGGGGRALHVTFCSHAVHLSCHSSHLVTLELRAATGQHFEGTHVVRRLVASIRVLGGQVLHC